ncbi:MAG: hypothetical protein AUJ98_04255 [Bacteroidetes bacterium CG2_30_33_31]|nr:MAG: hypothetical protein AUJ98_04255 [Bacteroidetes bacterium CG2_30_33_31]
MRNPFLQNPIRILLYAAWWILPGSIHSFVLWKTYNLPLPSVILDATISFIILAIIALSLWYMVKYSNVDINLWPKILQNHLLAMGVVFLIWTASSYGILGLLITDFSNIFYESLLWRFLLFLPVYLLIVFSYYLFAYMGKVKDQELQQTKMEILIREAEFNTLKAQINPHFLFNSLNSASSLTISNPILAREMIINISDFFRFTLLSSKKPYISLAEELEHSLLYLEIEKARFGDKIQVECVLPEELRLIDVPSLILQPIVENAVKHGVYESSKDIKISFMFEDIGDKLKIIIANEIDNNAGSPKKGTGTGLKNVASRLQIAFGTDDLLKTEKTYKEFTVTLWIPIKSIEKSNE